MSECEWSRRLVVHGVPKAQPRQRTRVAKGKAGKTFVQNYTPAKDPVNDFKNSVRQAWVAVHTGGPIVGAVRMDVVFVMPRTKGMVWKTKPMPRVWHTKKPDRDNLEKAVMDALTGMAWLDDAQVCQGVVEKWIAAGDEAPHVELLITALEEPPTEATERSGELIEFDGDPPF